MIVWNAPTKSRTQHCIWEKHWGMCCLEGLSTPDTTQLEPHLFYCKRAANQETQDYLATNG